MAKGIDLSALSLNPQEVIDMASFIVEQVFNRPDINRLHNVQTGIKMQEQIIFASQFGKTGLKATSSCTRQTSGVSSTLSEKFWNPVGIEDTLVHCQKEIDPLFKAYFSKIQSYKDNYEMEGTDEHVFLSILLTEAIAETVLRGVWFGDTAVAAAGSSSDGLISSGDIPYYNYFEGIWEQIFTAVGTGAIKRYSIALNSEITKALQLGLTTDLAKDTYFESIWALADPRLKAHPNATFLVSNAIWENYRKSLQSVGENFSIEHTQNGFRELNWNGKPIINMETIWDLALFADFYDNTQNQAYYLPNRIILTVPENIPIGTLNESDLTELESWYEKKDRTNNIAYGFSLDSKVLEEYMIVVGY